MDRLLQVTCAKYCGVDLVLETLHIDGRLKTSVVFSARGISCYCRRVYQAVTVPTEVENGLGVFLVDQSTP